MGRTRSRPPRVAILEVNTCVSSLANENRQYCITNPVKHVVEL